MEQNLTQLIDRVAAGDISARDDLMQTVYARLRAMAARQIGQGGRTLQPTALVHEAYLKLFGRPDPTWEGRHHFFGAAASAMRQAAVDHARRRHAQKRGGGRDRLSLSGLDVEAQGQVDILELDEALSTLASLDARQARVVELRYFAGLGTKDVATVLGVSPRTVELDWRTARAWLRGHMGTPE